MWAEKKEERAGDRQAEGGEGWVSGAHLVVLHKRRENVPRRPSLHALFKLDQPEGLRFQKVGEPLSGLVAAVPAFNVKTKNPGRARGETRVTSCIDRSWGRRWGPPSPGLCLSGWSTGHEDSGCFWKPTRMQFCIEVFLLGQKETNPKDWLFPIPPCWYQSRFLIVCICDALPSQGFADSKASAPPRARGSEPLGFHTHANQSRASAPAASSTALYTPGLHPPALVTQSRVPGY